MKGKTIAFQYPKGLLHTVEELDISHAVGVYPKTKFSMVLPEVKQQLSTLKEGKLKHIILSGIEVRGMYNTSVHFPKK